MLLPLQYLELPFLYRGKTLKSPYIAALMDARTATGRDESTGQITHIDKIGNWSGALAYMALIDHIGNHISKNIGGDTSSTKFVKALNDFTNLPEIEIYALYALRCAFAHQYSLINIGLGVKAPLLHHQFEVHRGDVNLMTLPITPWNGIRTPETNNLITSVSLRRLGDLVEQIHLDIIEQVVAGELKSEKELIYISYDA